MFNPSTHSIYVEINLNFVNHIHNFQGISPFLLDLLYFITDEQDFTESDKPENNHIKDSTCR